MIASPNNRFQKQGRHNRFGNRYGIDESIVRNNRMLMILIDVGQTGTFWHGVINSMCDDNHSLNEFV